MVSIGSFQYFLISSASVSNNSSAVLPSHKPKDTSLNSASVCRGSVYACANSSANSAQRLSGDVTICCQVCLLFVVVRNCFQPKSLKGSSNWPRYFLPPSTSPCRSKSIMVVLDTAVTDSLLTR